MPDPIIGQGYNQDIAYRYKPGQTAAEFYSQKTGQVFGDSNSLATYINSTYSGTNANAQNVFDVLAGGYTPRGQALDSITQQLNQTQNQIYGDQTTPKRQSSSLADSIGTETSNLNSYLDEFASLKKRLESLQSPNFQQAFTDLRNQQGLPQLETDFANNQKSIRELPYVNRQNFGNAGITTEGQLAADTQQKGIPLEIQQANLLDRLKLASDFVTNSLNLKEKDYNTAKEGISNAATLLGQIITMSRQHLGDLQAQQDKFEQRQDAALEFAYKNRISKPFFDVAGTVYRTSDLRPASSPEQYISMGGKGDFSDVQKISSIQSTSKFTKVGTDENGNDLYGFVNEENQTVKPFNSTGGGARLGSPVGEILGLPSYDTAAANPGVNRPNRNNNPGNIKVSDYTKNFDGVIGVESRPATDGGNFLIFDSPESGIAAIGRLLQEGKSYKGVTAEQAIKKYNGGGGYGAVDVGLNPVQDFQSQIRDPQKLQQVAQAIAKLEGFTGTSSSSSRNTVVTNAMNQVIPSLPGTQQKSFRTNINTLLGQGDEKAAADAVITGAINSTETATREKLRGKYTAIKQLDSIEQLLTEFADKGGSTNLLTGTLEQISQKVGQTSNPELAYIWNRIQTAIVAYRNAVSGAAFTESEAKQYQQLFPGIGVSGQVNTARINGLRDSFNLDISSTLETILGSKNYQSLQELIKGNPYSNYVQNISSLSPEEEYINSLFSSLSGTTENKTSVNTNLYSIPTYNKTLLPSLPLYK